MHAATMQDLTDEQLATRLRMAMRVLLKADAFPASLDWAFRMKQRVEAEQIRRAHLLGVAEREQREQIAAHPGQPRPIMCVVESRIGSGEWTSTGVLTPEQATFARKLLADIGVAARIVMVPAEASE